MARFLEGNLRGWLMRIAKNVCIDEWRKRRLQIVNEDLDGEAVTRSRGHGSSLESMTDLRFAAQRVRDEMAALPAEQRRCLELKIEG
jgi:DNA-directed RNA polymerase specialized sigma24 family protein